MRQRITVEQLRELSPEQQERLREEGYKECIVCGTYFYVSPCRRNTARCCSVDCHLHRERTPEERANMSKGQKRRDKKTINMAGLKLGRDLLKENNYNHMRGANNPGWSGGRIISSHGYILIWDADNGRYLEEHRVIMERHLGRPLKTNEVIHHKNGDKTDNSLDNLMLLTPSEHTKIHSLNMLSIRYGKTYTDTAVKEVL